MSAADSANSSAGSDSGESSAGSDSKSEQSSKGGESSQSQSSESKSSESSKSSDQKSSESKSSESSDGDSSKSGSSKDGSSRSGNENSSANLVPSMATAMGTSVALGFILWQVQRPPAAPPAAAPEEVGRAAQVYLRARTHQLREDLALGAGPTVDDLAAAARIRRQNLGTFGRVLRTHRAELLALADARTLTSERAVRWLQRVGELARMDPRLEEDHRAFVEWSAAGGSW
ncbi:hypothetical protein P2318_23215 [Myxococcaceae bacterium GXIMD 01537]